MMGYLTHLACLVWESVPDDWVEQPTHKNGSSQDCDNYTGI